MNHNSRYINVKLKGNIVLQAKYGSKPLHANNVATHTIDKPSLGYKEQKY